MNYRIENKLIWLTRILIGGVTFLNIQCALAFLISPQSYSAGFDLSGAHGEAVIRSLGILFLMWNVPYVVALWNPVSYYMSLVEAVIMQSIGVMGESLLLWRTPQLSEVVKESVIRFILFDSIGWVALVLALGIVQWIKARKFSQSYKRQEDEQKSR